MLKVYPAPDGCQAAFFRILRLARWRAGRYSSGMSKTYPEWMGSMVRDDGYIPWAEQVQPWPGGALAFNGPRLVFAPCRWDEEPRLAIPDSIWTAMEKHLTPPTRYADFMLTARKLRGAITRCGFIPEAKERCQDCNEIGRAHV